MLATLYLLFEKIKEWQKRRKQNNARFMPQHRPHCEECEKLMSQNASVFSVFKKI